jgi:hypothetical protein
LSRHLEVHNQEIHYRVKKYYRNKRKEYLDFVLEKKTKEIHAPDLKEKIIGIIIMI